MVAKTIDHFDWLGLGYVSKLGAKGESTAWTKIGEGMAPKGELGAVSRGNNGRLGRHRRQPATSGRSE